MKRIVFLLMLVALVLTMTFAVVGGTASAEGLRVEARSAYLMEASTGTVIYEQDASKRYPIASMVKIMTALIAFEHIDSGKLSLEESLTISDNAAGMGGSQMFIEAGDNYTVHDLLKGIVVVSANDASVAMAERIAGSEEEFVLLMNKRAKELGMNDSHFNNCTGLPAPECFSSAKDVAIMTSELIKHPDYYKFSKIWIENYTHPDGRVTEFVNTNKLIRFYKGCDGGKTGFTNEAMFCLSASAERNGMRVISVILGAKDSKTRFGESTKLLNTAFAKYENQLIADKDNFSVNNVELRGGKSDFLNVALESSYYALVKKGDKVNYETRVEIDKVKAPVNKGDKVGMLYVISNGTVIGERVIIAAEDVPEANYWDYVRKVLTEW